MTRTYDLPHNQPTRIKNHRCAYCNAEFSEEGEPEKEHVIGRLFVPKGSHNGQWNLHLNSCHRCNQDKSALENDISAISMIQTAGPSSEFDTILAGEAKRKGKTTSRRTRKPVSLSSETSKIATRFGDATISFGFNAPAQVDTSRLYRLARYQIAGFFFLLTYDEEKRQGYCWPGEFMPLGAVRRTDWGNPIKTLFSSAVCNWEFRFGGGPTSNGYFQALIKKHPTEALWSWALEWNNNYRLFGFLGNRAEAEQIISGFEPLQKSGPYSDGEANCFISQETPLLEDSDDLFFYVRDKLVKGSAERA